jgi:hypothetical protein
MGDNQQYTQFTVLKQVFTVHPKYKLIRELGVGAYGVVWYLFTTNNLVLVRIPKSKPKWQLKRLERYLIKRFLPREL